MLQNLQMTPDPLVIQPASAADVAGALKRASDARQSIVIRGAGTKSDWGRPGGRVDAILDMRGLNRVLEHQHGDMTATIEASATLGLAPLPAASKTLRLDVPDVAALAQVVRAVMASQLEPIAFELEKRR